ncbi:hypothetical protein [Nitrolancea hollandica]|uniref:hypothetical protein n=1 Tax=Nitrolancea hollandica TaxID=1206749 RepID=UPI0003070732|nr:hypothetical protein [Nitrolancea hollandica]
MGEDAGALTLALALGLTLTNATGGALPERELITFMDFGVILVTLLLHGFSLPFLIQWLRVTESADVHKKVDEEAIAWRAMVRKSLVRLDQLATVPTVSKEVVERLRARLLH